MFVRGAVLLALISATGTAQGIRACRDDPAQRGRIAALWTQLRPALESAKDFGAEGREPLGIRRFDRTLDRQGGIRSEVGVDARQYGMRLFRGVPPERLSREGFVVFDSAGTAEFRAPDPAVFLSAEFASDHCFDIVRGTATTAGLIGLRFQPAAGRGGNGIEGVFWTEADTASVALRFVEFAYRAPMPREASGVAGRLVFDQLPSGNWIVRDWIVRVPVMTQGRQLLGYREEGGEAMVVSRVMLDVMDSIASSRKPPGMIRGIVVDSLTMRGFSGATVWVDTAGSRTRADANGSFTLRGVRPGMHVVSFTHPMLDSIGVRPRAIRVRVGSDSTSNVALGGPAFHTLVGDVCGDSAAIVAGAVRDAVTNGPLDSADVTLSWIGIVFEPGRPLRIDPGEVTVQTNTSGHFAACVPPRIDITAHAQRGSARTGRVDVSTGMRRLGTLRFTLDRTATDTLAGSATLRGTVRYQDETPLSSAVVMLSEPELAAMTDSAGRFRFSGIPGGTRVINTRALGHAPVRNVIDLRPGDVTEVIVYMRKVHLLDPVVVRAAAGDRSVQVFADLEERRRTGQGYRLNQIELAAFKHARMDAVVRALPFVRLRGRSVILSNRRGGTCTPSVWVDGRKWTVEDLNHFEAADLVAIELFTSETQVPFQYREGRCGAIMIWTKDVGLAR
jgi:bifunctional DNA-binding transcriptional regulator/antitoxin component of YhaV-PrlF toxin-antitoxin module